MISWKKRKLAELIKRDTGIDIDPESIHGINRGCWFSYPEAYRWECKEIGGEKRTINCPFSQSLCLFLGGFSKDIYEEYYLTGLWIIDAENKNKRTNEEIIRFSRGTDRVKKRRWR